MASEQEFELVVRPRAPVTREVAYAQFGADHIWIDGAATGGPVFDPHKRIAIVDHHHGVIRGITGATCYQVYFGLPAGLFNFLRKSNVLCGRVVTIDCDPDITRTWYAFSRYPHTQNSAVRRIIHVTGEIDVCGGWHPNLSLESPILREFAYIDEIYAEARFSGELARMSATSMRGLIEATCDRIDRNVHGERKKIALNTAYDIDEHSRYGFVLVREHGFYARMRMRTEGVKHFVSVRPAPAPDRFLYSNGFLDLAPNPDVPPLEFQLRVLNAREAHAGGTETWGGSDIISGGPYSGSVLKPMDVVLALEECYAEHRARLAA